MNNNGDVVGKSVVYVNYKNNLYKQVHAAKWVNGQVIDLHREVPKAPSTSATAINDLGDVVIGSYLIRYNGEKKEYHFYTNTKPTATKYFRSVNHTTIYLDSNGELTNLADCKGLQDYDCIWMNLNIISDMNDNGDAVGFGTTIYGETHAILMTPIKSK